MIVHQIGFGKYCSLAWNLVVSADKEFCPPLSERYSTTQTALSDTAHNDNGPEVYFDQLSKQSNILVLENDRLIGFLSYVPDKRIKMGGLDEIGDYVSTIVVDKEYRNQGYAKKMYLKLIHDNSKNIYVRTWSGNCAHIKLLANLGFENYFTIENDRGKGIDTLYFRRIKNEKEDSLDR